MVVPEIPNEKPELVNEKAVEATQRLGQDALNNIDFNNSVFTNDRVASNANLPELALGKADNIAKSSVFSESKEDQATRAKLENERMPNVAESLKNHDEVFSKAMQNGDFKGAMNSLEATTKIVQNHVNSLTKDISKQQALVDKDLQGSNV